MSLRTRITFVVSGFTAIIVLIAGFAVHQFTESDIRSRLDTRLLWQVNQLAEPEIFMKTVALGRFYHDYQEDVEEQLEKVLDVQIPTRILIGQQTLIATRGFPDFTDVSLTEGFSDVNSHGEMWRVWTKTLSRRGRGSLHLVGEVTVQAAITRDALSTTLQDFRERFFIIGVIAVLGAGIGGWFLGGAALQPLNRLKNHTETLRDAKGFSQRVPEKLGPREVEVLARTLNETLAQMEVNSQMTEQALNASRAFASNVAHELRTPLTSIRMNLDLLERYPNMPSAEKANVLASIVKEQDHLLSTLESLRILARSELSENEIFEEIDLVQLIQDIMDRHQKQWPDTNFRLNCSAVTPLLYGWREGLAVLFRNVLDNAQVHNGRPTEDLFVEITIVVQGKELTVNIDDNGVGIPESEIDDVLERFHRGTNSTAAGSGLGLSLVKQQAELHGGSVSLSRSPWNGSRVSVVFPFTI